MLLGRRPASPSPAPRPDGVWDEVLSASSLSVEEDDEVPDLVLEADDDDKKVQDAMITLSCIEVLPVFIFNKSLRLV